MQGDETWPLHHPSDVATIHQGTPATRPDSAEAATELSTSKDNVQAAKALREAVPREGPDGHRVGQEMGAPTRKPSGPYPSPGTSTAGRIPTRRSPRPSLRSGPRSRQRRQMEEWVLYVESPRKRRYVGLTSDLPRGRRPKENGLQQLL